MKALPSGFYDKLITHGTQAQLLDDEITAELADLSPDTAPELLARHLMRFLTATLSTVKGEPSARLEKQLALANGLLRSLQAADASVHDDDLVTPNRLLRVVRRSEQRLGSGELVRPSVPLRH